MNFLKEHPIGTAIAIGIIAMLFTAGDRMAVTIWFLFGTGMAAVGYLSVSGNFKTYRAP